MNTVEFYATISGCANTVALCPGVGNSRASGWPPRDFFTEAKVAPIDVLADCKNPGHLLPAEALIYQRRSGAEIAREHLLYASGTFKGENDQPTGARRSNTFHKNLLRYLSFFLDVPAPEVFQRVGYTNLVKSSTVSERDPLHPKTMT